MTFKELSETQGTPANDRPGKLVIVAPVAGRSRTLPSGVPAKVIDPVE